MFKQNFSALALAGAALVTSWSANAETLIVTSNIPPSHFLVVQGLDPWMACVTEKTGGEITFEHYHSGQIANIFQSVDAVNSGLAHIALTTPTFLTDRLPLNGIPLLPGLGGTVPETVRAHRKVLTEDGPLAKELWGLGVKLAFVQMHANYQILSTGAPIETLAAFGGKKISSGGGTLQMTLGALGASTLELPATDVYVAMQQGTLDGTLMGLASSNSYKLLEVTKSVSSNGKFGVSSTFWVIDSKKWDDLGADSQKLMTECSVEIEEKNGKWVEDNDLAMIENYRKGGANVYEFSDSELAAMDERMSVVRDGYISRLAERGMPAQEAYDAYVKALAASVR